MRAFMLYALVFAACYGCSTSGSNDYGSDTTTTAQPKPSDDAQDGILANRRSTVSTDPSETRSTVDLGPIEQVQMIKPIRVVTREQPDGTATKEVRYDASSEEYTISLELYYENSTALEHPGIVAGSPIGTLHLIPRSDKVTYRSVEGSFTIDAGTPVTIRVNDVRLLSVPDNEAAPFGPLSGTISGEVETACSYFGRSSDPYAPRKADGQVPRTRMSDSDWSSEFCSRYAP